MDQNTDSFFSVQTLFGVLIAISSAALSSFGVNLQARSLRDERIISSLAESRHPAAELLLVDSAVRNSPFQITHNDPSSNDMEVVRNDSVNIQNERESLNIRNEITQFESQNERERVQFESLPIAESESLSEASCDDPPPPFLDSFLVYFYKEQVEEAQMLAFAQNISQSPSSNLQTLPTGHWRARVMARIWLRAQWWIGFIFYLLCQLFGGVIALAFISPLLLAPLGSTGLVFNIIFGRVFLGTGISTFDWLGTFMIVVGCSIVSLFGNRIPKPDQTISEIMKLLSQPTFIAYSSILLFACIFLFILIKTVEINLKSLREDALRSSTLMDGHLSRNYYTITNSCISPNPLTIPSIGLSPYSSSTAQNTFSQNALSPTSPQLETATSLNPSIPPTMGMTSSSNHTAIFSINDPNYQQKSASNRHHHRSLVIETSSDLLISPSTFTYPNIEFQSSQKTPVVAEFISPKSKTIVDGTLEEREPLLLHPSSQPVSVKKGILTSLVGILYSVLGGSVASLTLLLTKSGVSIFIGDIFKRNQGLEQKLDGFQVAFLSCLLLILVSSVIVQIYSLNQALKYELPTLVLPLFFSFYTVLSLFNTMVYVNAFGTTGVIDILILFGGVGVLVLGVSLLGRKPT